MICSSTFFGVMVSIMTYWLGCCLKKKFKIAIFNPLLVAIVCTILLLIGLNVDYTSYNEGAKYLSYLLTPATVCLAVPLYEQFELLKKNLKAIIAGIVSGIITSLTCIFIFAVIFGFSHEEYVTLLPKSVTTAIGIGISEELHGHVTITIAVIIVTGIIGNIVADFVCRIFKITDPVAKGIGIGSASHAVGTAKAMEMGEAEGAMSSLSVAITGILTVVFASIYANFL